VKNFLKYDFKIIEFLRLIKLSASFTLAICRRWKRTRQQSIIALTPWLRVWSYCSCSSLVTTLAENHLFRQGNPHRRGRLSTVVLLVPPSLAAFVIAIIFFTKQVVIMRKSIILSLLLQLVLPDPTHRVVNQANVDRMSGVIAVLSK